MSLGSDFSAFAVAEITNGELWTHVATIHYGPRRVKTNKWDEATDAASIAPQTLNVAAFPVEKPVGEGGIIRSLWEIIAPAATVSVEPQEEDQIELAGINLIGTSTPIRHNIVSINPIGANGVNAAYIILADR